MAIRFLRRKDINTDQWNACVAGDDTALPYGLAWWLDAATSGKWDAVVVDDYRLVLPLPRGKSFGRWTQVQRPVFTQQCGPFGQLQPGDLAEILRRLPGKYLSFNLPLSERLLHTGLPAGFAVRERTNYVLDMAPAYDEVHQGFNKVLRRKLRRNGPATLSQANPATIIELYRGSVGQKAGLKAKHYRRIAAIIDAASANGAAVCCRLDDAENGFLAAGFFPFYRGRLINTFAASSPAGYAREGMARMIVELIKTHGGPGHLLDFEGSDIPGVAEFFRSFGPVQRNYPMVGKEGLARWIGRV